MVKGCLMFLPNAEKVNILFLVFYITLFFILEIMTFFFHIFGILWGKLIFIEESEAQLGKQVFLRACRSNL